MALSKKKPAQRLACLACCVGRRKPKLHQDHLTLLFDSVQEMGQFGFTLLSLTTLVKFCKFFLRFSKKRSEKDKMMQLSVTSYQLPVTSYQTLSPLIFQNLIIAKKKRRKHICVPPVRFIGSP
jgi:hypothetical protein